MCRRFQLATLACVVSVGFWGNVIGQISSEEKEAIDKFRPTVANLLSKDYMKVDTFLLRWLKDANFDQTKALENFQRFHKWRQDHNMDTILEEDLSAHNKALPYKFDGFDKGGHPILIIPLGHWQIRKYIVAGKREAVARQWYFMLEKANHLIYEAAKSSAKDISRIYYLQDLDGYSLREHGCLACAPLFYEMTRDFALSQPFLLQNATIINVPRPFAIVMEVVKTLVPEGTRNIIHIYDHNKEQWMPSLLKDIMPDQLPTKYGGTKTN